jgi:Predicted membrane protein (DUF2142)
MVVVRGKGQADGSPKSKAPGSLVPGEGGMRDQRRRRTGPVVWAWFFLGLLCFSTLWSLATPLGAGPDESNHLVRASALMHGQLVGVAVPGSTSAYTRVQVSGAYASTIILPECYVFRPAVPAGCSPPLSKSAKQVPTIIYVGRYPPLYYALVGWPTRFVADPVVAFYLGRLLNGIANCVFLALAASLASRTKSPKFLLVGVLTALSPMVLYLSAVINPNSLEVSAALCLWTGTILLAHEMPTPEMSRSLVRIVALAAVVVALIRPDSPLWILLVAAALSPIVFRSGVGWRSVGRRRDVLAGAAAVVAACVASAVWTVREHATTVGSNPPPPASASFINLVRGAAGQASNWVIQAIGDFGWQDDRAPLVTVLAWVAATGSLVLLGLSFARPRQRLALLLTLVIAVTVPLALVLVVVRHDGYIGLGRYFLALFVGIPIVASVAVDPAVRGFAGFARLQKTFIVLLIVGHVFAFWWGIQRYLVGRNGSFSPTATVVSGWNPPLPAAVLDSAFAILAAIATVAVVRFLEHADVGNNDHPAPTGTH